MYVLARLWTNEVQLNCGSNTKGCGWAFAEDKGVAHNGGPYAFDLLSCKAGREHSIVQRTLLRGR